MNTNPDSQDAESTLLEDLVLKRHKMVTKDKSKLIEIKIYKIIISPPLEDKFITVNVGNELLENQTKNPLVVNKGSNILKI